MPTQIRKRIGDRLVYIIKLYKPRGARRGPPALQGPQTVRDPHGRRGSGAGTVISENYHPASNSSETAGDPQQAHLTSPHPPGSLTRERCHALAQRTEFTGKPWQCHAKALARGSTLCTDRRQGAVSSGEAAATLQRCELSGAHRCSSVTQCHRGALQHQSSSHAHPAV